MNKIIDIIFLRNYKMLVGVALLLFALLVVFFILSATFLANNFEDALSDNKITHPTVVYFDFASFNKIKGRLDVHMAK